MFFQQVFDILLSELEPVCSKEQSFVQQFFDLESEEEVGDYIKKVCKVATGIILTIQSTLQRICSFRKCMVISTSC